MQPEEEMQPLKSTIKQAGKGKSGHSVENEFGSFRTECVKTLLLFKKLLTDLD